MAPLALAPGGINRRRQNAILFLCTSTASETANRRRVALRFAAFDKLGHIARLPNVEQFFLQQWPHFLQSHAAHD